VLREYAKLPVMGNSFGRLFRLTTFGESHGVALGAVVDGCPAGLALDAALVQRALDRRRPGQSTLVTQRKELDEVEIVSGTDGGLTLGTPIAMTIRNTDAKPRDYAAVSTAFRPSHADYTYHHKFGVSASSGGGRASARETVARVAGGAVAELVLAAYGIEIVAWVDQVGELRASVDGGTVNRQQVDSNPVRCPVAHSAIEMQTLIEQVRKDGDSVGGVVAVVARGLPAGWGEPVFDKLDAELAKALLSIPAVKGFEIGSGFSSASMRGSTHNDAIYRDDNGAIRTRTNHAGGVVGGISNGEHLVMRVAFKPTATIMQAQQTIDRDGNATSLSGRGRHDACVLPRAVPIVEAMVALVLADHALLHRCRAGFSDHGTQPKR
jgi:chorismate synthase